MAVTTPAEFSLHRKYLADRTDPIKWVWSHARRHWWIMVMMVIGAIGNAGLAAVVPVLTGDAFNAMLKPVPDTSVLIPLALIIGVSQVIRGALQLAFPQGPLDRVRGQAGRADDQRKRGAEDHQRVAAAVPPKPFQSLNHAVSPRRSMRMGCQ